MKHEITGNTTNITSANKTAIDGSVADIITKVTPAASEIAPEQKKDFQQIGLKLESVVREAQDAAHTHPEVLPATYVATNIDKYLQNYDDFGHIENQLLQVLKIVQDSRCVNGICAANEANIIYGYLQMAVTGNPAIRDIVEPMEEYYKKGPRKDYVSFNLNPSTSVAINVAIPGTRVINTGTARIQISAGPNITGKAKKVVPFNAEPGNSAVIPTGFTSINVTNLSATDSASFSIKVKQ